MLVKQISIFLENKSGRLAEVTKILGDNNIDISALSIADTTDFGILRIIVNDPEKAEEILTANGYAVSSTSVIAIAVPDEPGGLAKALEVIASHNIGIEYMYAFVGKCTNEAMVILRVENPESVVDILTKNDIKVLPANFVYDL
ncbi:MAG TPA: ACT domain-containing protein [Clostridiaceae bacterium]|nr:ACT domain-containing protein [Clostridiaceae bacterium]